MSATSLPQYRIRFDDGSEVVVPTAEELESRVARGEILPKTVIFDAGRGVWCRAGDAPLIRFIVEEAAHDRKAPLPGWSDEEQAAAASPLPSAPKASPPTSGGTLKIEPPAAAPFSGPKKVDSPASSPGATAPRHPDAPRPAVPEPRKLEPAASAPTKVTPIATGKGNPPLTVLSTTGTTRPEAPAASAAASPAKGDLSVVPGGAPGAQKGASAPTPPVHTVRPASAPIRRAAPPSGASPAAASSPASPKAGSRPETKAPETALPAPTPVSASPAAASVQASAPAASGKAPAESITAGAPASQSPTPVKKTEPAKPVQEAPRAARKQPKPATSGVVVGEIVPGAAASAAVPVESLAPAAGMGRWVATAKRRGVLVTSLVGGAAALVVVGVVVQGRSDREEARQPVPTVASYEAPFTVDQVPELTAGSDSALEAALAAEAVEQAPPVDTSPAIRMPSAPVLTNMVLPGNVNVAPSYSDQPAGPLPLPTRPTQPSEDQRNQPTMRAVTRAPQVTNAVRVQEALARQYPVGLRQAEIGGRVEMAFSIDERGEVRGFQIKQGSGIPELDQAALKVAETFAFSAALSGTEPVATSVTVPITFGTPRSTPTSGAGARPNTPAAANQPVPAQFDTPPQVRNANRVQQTALSEYPIGLRDTGMGGKVEMWFYVNERGEVERFQIGQSSGNKDLDAAALRVARIFQFNPARRGNQPVATWYSFGITFGGSDPLDR